MVGTSMMMSSFGFMIYTISPAYSNSEKDKKEIKNTSISNAPIGSNGVIYEGKVYFVDAGSVYRWDPYYYNQGPKITWNNSAAWQKEEID